MPDKWVSEEVRATCYKNRDTCDADGNPRTICHHIDFNHDNNDPENLIFLSVKEHYAIHDFGHNAKKLIGTTRPDEVKAKISATKRERYKNDLEWSAKRKAQFNAAMNSPTAKAKRALANKNKRWWTDGVHNEFTEHCPDGYHAGMTKRKRVAN